jgi:hypothetical protein
VRRKCFVICPFGEPGTRTRRWSDFLVENIIRPAAGNDYDVARTIDVPIGGGDITDRIHRELRQADIVVADLSDGNTNVSYELGIRHALGRPYVLVCRVDTKPPFDLRNLSTVFVDAEYLEGKQQFLMAAPARVAAELAAHMRRPVVNRLDSFKARAFDWTTTYSPMLAKDWLLKQDRPIQEAIRGFDENGGPSTNVRHDDPLMTKVAEYHELKNAANQKYRGQLFYVVNPINLMETGFAIYRFPTSTLTIDATGREDEGESAVIKFDQPARDVQVAGLKVTLPTYQYSVRFTRRVDATDVLAGDLNHPDTGTLLGRSELVPRWGLGM